MISRIEAELAPFGVRPHWGKQCQVDPQLLQRRYSKFTDFLAADTRYDPNGNSKRLP